MLPLYLLILSSCCSTFQLLYFGKGKKYAGHFWVGKVQVQSSCFINTQEPKVKGTKPALPFKCYWVGFSPHTCNFSRNGLGSVKDGEPHFVVVHCTGYIKAWPPAGRKVE